MDNVIYKIYEAFADEQDETSNGYINLVGTTKPNSITRENAYNAMWYLSKEGNQQITVTAIRRFDSETTNEKAGSLMVMNGKLNFKYPSPSPTTITPQKAMQQYKEAFRPGPHIASSKTVASYYARNPTAYRLACAKAKIIIQVNRINDKSYLDMPANRRIRSFIVENLIEVKIGSKTFKIID